MSRWSDEVAANAVGILVYSLIGGIALMILLGGAVLGLVGGAVAGAGVKGFQIYRQRKAARPWEEPGDGAGLGLYEGIFLGEEHHWD